MSWQRIIDAFGMAQGGGLRGGLARLLAGLGFGEHHTPNAGDSQVAFTAAVIALSAKMAKSDGVASQIEFEAFQRVFKPAPDEERNVTWLFNLAKRDTAGFESYSEQIKQMLNHEPQLLRDVFEGLFHIAAADGVLHTGEEVFLKRVAEIFGYDEVTYRAIRAVFVHDPDDAYTILGLTPDVETAALRAHYRALVRENHPDALIARGVPKTFIDMAERKLAAINAAYGQIARERGI